MTRVYTLALVIMTILSSVSYGEERKSINDELQECISTSTDSDYKRSFLEPSGTVLAGEDQERYIKWREERYGKRVNWPTVHE